eukprot:1145590-Pelagomonas_calceolata.AAC.3
MHVSEFCAHIEQARRHTRNMMKKSSFSEEEASAYSTRGLCKEMMASYKLYVLGLRTYGASM